LAGGAGDDDLKGGSGNDTFIFRPGEEGGEARIRDFKIGDVLKFEGDDFTADDISISQSGKNAVITIGGNDMEITLDRVDADKLASYSVTESPEGDVFICYEDDLPGS